ncbi:sulfite exporter TauE/SafE family protein [Acidihalobacter prosperus]|uniref:Probable membrane transporter protein n=1 Tax=Acidihalobacter prosperus TaxID=160660 RepID=A0A1A6C8F7_9GAMM|nr:sulfite exporter TauE/SafE family protein [Acidihalobacter prosperus]OBS10852.1 hypothetical protein Thpro_020568 [Acidihalobacter prosperus]
MDATAWLVASIALVLFCGGFIKGAIGIGMPVFVVSVLGGFLTPHLVIAILLVPIVVSNLWQCLSSVHLRWALARFWPLILAFGLGTWAGTRLLVSVPTEGLFVLLGCVVLGFCLTSWLNPHLHLPPRLEGGAGPLVGLFAGVLNGVSLINGPPLILYLVALRLEREHFIGAYGLIALCGSVPLSASLIGLGVVTLPQLWWSTLALIPVMLGLALGQYLRRRIDQARFRRLLLVALALLGANLLRRGVMG